MMNKLTKIILGIGLTTAAVITPLKAKTLEDYNQQTKVEKKENKIADYTITTGLIATPFIFAFLLPVCLENLNRKRNYFKRPKGELTKYLNQTK